MEVLQEQASAKRVLEAHLAARNEALTQLQARVISAEEEAASARRQWQQGERELAAVRARLETHEALLKEWRDHSAAQQDKKAALP
ncbi:hypothetical protein ABTA44_19370, partial [Acinetobacter baumannii]